MSSDKLSSSSASRKLTLSILDYVIRGLATPSMDYQLPTTHVLP